MSDHSPILLNFKLCKAFYKPNAKPFHFENHWLTEPSLRPLVKSVWQKSSRISQDHTPQSITSSKLHLLSETLQKWSSRLPHYNIKRSINETEKYLECIQKATPSQANLEQEASLVLHLEDLRDKENTFWKQRSKSFWLENCDRNTKFCHTNASYRYKKKQIYLGKLYLPLIEY